MKIEENFWWIFYRGDTSKFIDDKVGKWTYRFKTSDDIERIKKLCSDAVEQGIVKLAKHTNPVSFGLNPNGNADTGVCCFYLNCDDTEGHKKILSYFIKNNMIQRTKTGRLYNISFKLDAQTRAGQYGNDFIAQIKLDEFINLDTGEWLI